MYNERHVTEPAMCNVPREMLYETKPRCYKDQTSHLQPGNISPDDAAAERPDLQGEVWEMSRSYHIKAATSNFSGLMLLRHRYLWKSLSRQLPV